MWFALLEAVPSQRLISKVTMDRELICPVAELCLRLNIDGHRGELTIPRGAKALAAFQRRRRVTTEDVRRVAAMSLRHRLRQDLLGEIDAGEKIVAQTKNWLRSRSW